jgi:molybdopterin biosynthesis enzyme
MAKRTTSPYELKSVVEVNEIIKRVTSRLNRDTEQLDMTKSSMLGYLLAEDVHAADHLPPFPASIKVNIASAR